MDTKFSSAIHLLIMISESEEPLTSEMIARSIGTNASYVRKIIGYLKRKKIISSRQGRSGFELNIRPEDLSLLEIYKAVSESEEIHLFDIHKNPNDQCIVGRYIKPTLGEMFGGIETMFSDLLSEKTLEDCIELIKREQEEEDERSRDSI